jgi:hypothetical protein
VTAYQEPGGPLRRAAAVASRDGDLVATTPARRSSTHGASRPRGYSTTTSPGRSPQAPVDALADGHDRGFMVEHVMELLATGRPWSVHHVRSG